MTLCDIFQSSNNDLFDIFALSKMFRAAEGVSKILLIEQYNVYFSSRFSHAKATFFGEQKSVLSCQYYERQEVQRCREVHSEIYRSL